MYSILLPNYFKKFKSINGSNRKCFYKANKEFDVFEIDKSANILNVLYRKNLVEEI